MKNFKKITSLILAIFIIASVPMLTSAAPYTGTPIGNQGVQDSFVLDAVYLSDEHYSHEDPIWDYSDNTYRYTDENGTTWRYYCEKNWIVSKENNLWLYKVLEDNTIYIIDNPDVDNEELNIKIPSSLEGMTVTRVMGAGNDDTLSIEIPDTVTAIDFWAFRGRDSLKRVVIPTSIKSINVAAFDATDNIELYYAGTESQWNEIIVWNHSSLFDSKHWAVTGFDWLEMPYDNGIYEESWVKAVHFNVDPDTLEDLVPEEENPQQSVFDQIFAPIKTFFATVISFFKMIVSWFTFGQ